MEMKRSVALEIQQETGRKSEFQSKALGFKGLGSTVLEIPQETARESVVVKSQGLGLRV